MRIIAVDDEMEALSNFLLTIVNDKRIEYKFFQESPLDAVDYCKHNVVSGAFLDIHMPVVNGVELAKRLIKVNPEMKIVFITAFTYDEEAIKKELGNSLLGFCYKPFDPERINGFISLVLANGKRKIHFRCLGPFDLFVNNQAISFSSSKAKELLALLVCYRGATLTMADAFCHLWPDKDVELAKKLYRDAIWRLRKTLKDSGVGNIVDFEKGRTLLHPENIQCDYWDALDEQAPVQEENFLPSYDWATELLMQGR